MDRLISVSDVLAETDRELAAGRPAGARVWSTGFPMLDAALGGGLRSGELTLLGGPQGLGKTSFVLQLLRNTVSLGNTGVYFSYEHDTATLAQRLIALEASAQRGVEAPRLAAIRAAMEATDRHSGALEQRLADIGAAEAVQQLSAYGDRLLIHRSSGSTTDVEEIRDVALTAAARTGQPPLVVVDYLQKVAVDDPGHSEEELVSEIVEGLKDLALEHELPVLAVAAAEKEGLAAGKRLRVHHLRGSSALAYEPDVVLIMNEKYDVVARHHLVYDTANADRFHNWVVVSVEKNRSGPDGVDIEFRKRFEHGLFDTAGRRVAEQLVDERTFTQ